jgi:ribose 1,5-bisphosphokinase PhnN
MNHHEPAPITVMVFGPVAEKDRLIDNLRSRLDANDRAFITFVESNAAPPHNPRHEEGRPRATFTVILFGPMASGKTTLINKWVGDLDADQRDAITFGETTDRGARRLIEWKYTRPTRRLYQV